jgi:hypothetical protein
MFDMIRFTVGAVLWAGVCSWALARGEWPERAAAITTLVGSLLTPVANVLLGRFGFHHVGFSSLAIDGSVLAVNVIIAVRANRWWPVYSAAFHLCQLMTHIARLTRPELMGAYYVGLVIAWSHLALGALAVGMIQLEIRRWKRRAEHSPAPATDPPS